MNLWRISESDFTTAYRAKAKLHDGTNISISTSGMFLQTPGHNSESLDNYNESSGKINTTAAAHLHPESYRGECEGALKAHCQ